MSDTIVLLGRTYRTEKVGDCIQLLDIKPNSYGYPRLCRLVKGKRKYYSASRILLGITDPKVFACHHCDNRACVNIDHLYVGNAQSNMKDRDSRGRLNIVNCLPEWKKNEIFELDQAYGPLRASECLGVAMTTVRDYRKTFFSRSKRTPLRADRLSRGQSPDRPRN